MQKTIAEINVKAVAENASAFKKLTKTRLCAVVKADAYGHGAEKVALALADIADCFAVAIADEAVKIKSVACGKDILVLTPPIDDEDAERILENGFIASVADLVTAKKIIRVWKRLCLSQKGGLIKSPRIHIKVNTGMNRYGASLQLLGKICKYLKSEGVQAEGLFSHLYLHERTVAEKQRLAFVKAQTVCKRYFSSFISHLSATYGGILGEKFAFDMVRIGLGLYGYLPDDTPNKTQMEESLALRKAMRVKARAVCSKSYMDGGLGYMEGSVADKQKAARHGISVVRFGYADGFIRNALHGYKQIGGLCMDAQLSCGRLKKGAFIEIMSDAYQAAQHAGTICYEILCNVTKRAEIVYLYE